MDIYDATTDFVNLRQFNVVGNPDSYYEDNCLEIQKIELNCNGEEMPSQMHKSWIIPQARVSMMDLLIRIRKIICNIV